MPRPTALAVPAVLALSLAVATGCGPSCRQIGELRTTLLPRSAAPGTHARLILPFALANGLLAQALRGVAPQPLAPAGLGPLASALSDLTVAPRRLALVPARAGYVGFEIGLELRKSPAGCDAARPGADGDPGAPCGTGPAHNGARALLSIDLALEARPQLHGASARGGDGARELVIGFGPQSLRAVRPRLAPDASERLADALHDELPALAKLVISRQTVARVAARVVTELGSRTFELLRDTLLRRVADQTRLTLRLPPLLVQRVELRSETDAEVPALVVDVATALPTRAALPEYRSAQTRVSARDARQVELRMSAATMAALANWAMARGLLPARYDRRLRPSEQGGFRPLLDWQPGGLPLKIHVFRASRPCAHLRIGVRPSVRLTGDKLTVRSEDRAIEQIDGSALVKLGVWLDGLVSSTVDTSGQRATHTRVVVGGRALRAKLVRAALSDDELVLGLSMQLEPLPQRGR